METTTKVLPNCYLSFLSGTIILKKIKKASFSFEIDASGADVSHTLPLLSHRYLAVTEACLAP